jgi:hypothetical protein
VIESEKEGDTRARHEGRCEYAQRFALGGTEAYRLRAETTGGRSPS